VRTRPLSGLVHREGREVLLAQANVVAKHRQCSPEERALGAVRTASGREEAAEVKEAGA